MSSPDIYLELAPGVCVGVPQGRAFVMTRREFARLYRRHVVGASRKAARAWAAEQVALRAANA